MAQKISKEEAFQFLEKHTRFLLVGHIRPDGDDIGAGIHGKRSGYGYQR